MYCTAYPVPRHLWRHPGLGSWWLALASPHCSQASSQKGQRAHTVHTQYVQVYCTINKRRIWKSNRQMQLVAQFKSLNPSCCTCASITQLQGGGGGAHRPEILLFTYTVYAGTVWVGLVSPMCGWNSYLASSTYYIIWRKKTTTMYGTKANMAPSLVSATFCPNNHPSPHGQIASQIAWNINFLVKLGISGI